MTRELEASASVLEADEKCKIINQFLRSCYALKSLATESLKRIEPSIVLRETTEFIERDFKLRMVQVRIDLKK